MAAAAFSGIAGFEQGNRRVELMLVENGDAVLAQHRGGDAAAGHGTAREAAVINTATAARGDGLGQNRYRDRRCSDCFS